MLQFLYQLNPVFFENAEITSLFMKSNYLRSSRRLEGASPADRSCRVIITHRTPVNGVERVKTARFIRLAPAITVPHFMQPPTSTP
jgi:hypothetical protein